MLDRSEYSLAELADALGAVLVGDAQYVITGLANLQAAETCQISFLSSSKYAQALATTVAGCVVLRDEDAMSFTGNKLIVKDPYAAYAHLSSLFEPRNKREPCVHPNADVHPTVRLGDNVAVGPNCVIGEGAHIGDGCELYAGVFIGERASVGENCVIFPNVVIYHDVTVGNDVIIHANTSIGSDGFGFAPTESGWKKIHQIGSVRIGNRVEIGANCSFDRGAIEDTVIGDGVIIDNQVHLAHNVSIGDGTAIAGCVGIAGSTSIGKNCQIAGAVAINGHLDIADNTIFSGGTIVTRGNREAGVFASISPMQDVKSWRKNSVRYRQLDSLFSRVKKLEKKSESSDS